jgi:hypothetical protein
MLKKIIGILVVLSLISIVGCSSGTKTSTATKPADVNTVRDAEIAAKWNVKHLEINTKAEITLTLKLADGDKVDGYFYLEKGSNVGFQVAGSSKVYESQPVGTKSDTITSDRFSFTASQAQGVAYFLTFNPDSNAQTTNEVTIFMELIYPATGSLSVPIGTK